MNKRLIILNIIFISICGLLLVNDFYYIIRDGFISMDGMISSHTIKFFTTLISLIIGIILLNVFTIKNKLMLGISMMLVFIVIGIVGANITYDKYNEVTSGVDWFSDGIN